MLLLLKLALLFAVKNQIGAFRRVRTTDLYSEGEHAEFVNNFSELATLFLPASNFHVSFKHTAYLLNTIFPPLLSFIKSVISIFIKKIKISKTEHLPPEYI